MYFDFLFLVDVVDVVNPLNIIYFEINSKKRNVRKTISNHMYARARFFCFYFKCALHPIHFKASYFALFFLLFFLFCIENYKSQIDAHSHIHIYIFVSAV